LRAIEAELRRELGPYSTTGSKTSLAYIAGILRAGGVRVELPARFDDRYLDPEMDEPYAGRLEGVLHFGNFVAAEAAIRKLDALYREYRNVADRRGTSLVRSLVLKGKQRAESLARNPRVSEEKRREKQEIAAWFRVWLEVPDLFFDWLEMRKQSEEFRSLFAKDNDELRDSSSLRSSE
jgi:hypothetical protein